MQTQLTSRRTTIVHRLLMLTLVALLAMGALPGFGPSAVLARDDDDPRDPTGGGYDDTPTETPYEPPANGFNWTALSRFGTYKDGIVNFHYDQATATYDPNYIYPSVYKVQFDACTSSVEKDPTQAVNNYIWTITGEGLPTTGVTRTEASCSFVFDFPQQVAYNVKLTVAAKDGSGTPKSYEQKATIRDYLIVAIGDSYGSGEGNPDVPQQFDSWGIAKAGARWQDKRCHRSAAAGSSQAAMMIERADPHTTVTYISFACSGATIATPSWKDMDADKRQGTGILGRYRGVETPDSLPYANRNTDIENFDQYIPSQIDQVRNALTPPNGGAPRQVDALLVSGGGNDLRFGDVAVTCVLVSSCWDEFIEQYPNGNRYQLQTIVNQLLQQLPHKYDDLAEAITSLNIPAGNVYITEYPDSMRGDNSDFCYDILNDILVGKHIRGTEVTWAHDNVFSKLNQQVEAAAARNSWNFVGGIADKFRYEGGRGHGYCASSNWIRTARESVLMQGPTTMVVLPERETKGTLHPTARGHYAYAEQIVATLKLDHPNNTPPTFAVTAATGPAGGNGWYTGPASMTIKATDSNKIAGAGLSVNGTGGCDVAGVTCSVQTTAQDVVWTVTASAEGVYRLEFIAEDALRSGSSFVQELKIDLNDPTTSAPTISGTAGNEGWYRSEVDVTLNAADTAVGSGVEKVLYTVATVGSSSLVAASEQEATYGETIKITQDGVHTVTYRAVDLAGRESPVQTLTLKVDATAPALDCAEADGTWHNTNVTLPCTASDAASGLMDTANVSFGLSTDVPDNTETDTASTNSRTVCDVAGNCAQAGPITGNKIDRKAPSITLTNPTAATYVLNQPVVADYGCADGGSGVKTCAGPVASGSNIDTATVGVKTFTVNASDNVDNASSSAVEYKVTYNICALYDQTKAHKAGSVVPIKLQLCDAANKNVSALNIVVTSTKLTKTDSTASGTVEDAGSANPDSNFRYDATLGGYVYNLSTKGLMTGTWELTFSVAGDPVPHTVRFDVK